MKRELYKYKKIFLGEFKKINIELFDLIIYFIPVIFFGYVWYVYFPGALTYDSYNQLNQIETFKFSDGHPLIHTLIELLMLKIWNNPAIIGLFQIQIFSVIWTVICKYNRRNIEGSAIKIFQLLITLFVSINPLNSIHSITLWKDILYSYMILLTSFLFQVFADKKFELNDILILSTAFLLAIIPNLRHNGLIISLGCFVILTVILLIKNINKKKLISFIFLTLFFFLLFLVPSKILIKNSETSPVLNIFNYKILHIAGDYLNRGVFNYEDKKFLESFIDLDEILSSYNPYFMDPMLSLDVDQEEYLRNESEFRILLLKRSLENPRYFLNYLGNSTTIIWRINLPIDMVGTVLTTGYDSSNNINDIQQIHINEDIFQEYNEYISDIFSNKITKVIFFSPAFYLYLSLVLILLGFVTKVFKISYVLILIPNLLNLIGLAISIPVQDARYVYASFLVGYLSMVIFISRAIINRNSNKRKGNTLEILSP